MKCPFCAEEIQSGAILCRFCGATQRDGQWRPPVLASRSEARPTRRPNFTIRAAGLFFLVSALFEGYFLRSEVLLFGEPRGAAVAIGYHLLYAGLFLAMGAGLWSARPWAFKAMLAGTIVYTVDKAQYLVYGEALEADLMRRLGGYGDLVDMMDEGALLQLMILLTVLFVACWWGFLFYLYYHRRYFEEERQP